MICRIYDVPGATLEQYDQVSEHMGDERPDGAHAHIAGKTDQGIRVIEAWDSAEHDEQYTAAGLGAAMQAAGIPEPTSTDFEIHNRLARLTDTGGPMAFTGRAE